MIGGEIVAVFLERREDGRPCLLVPDPDVSGAPTPRWVRYQSARALVSLERKKKPPIPVTGMGSLL
jgi:hypothetical protein